MNELRRIAENIQTEFEGNEFPQEFLKAYDQMECLASHNGRGTYLVRSKKTGETAIAKWYDRRVFPLRVDADLLMQIRHSGIPHFFEKYENEQTLCIVREYIEGEPLSDYAEEHQLTEKEILAIGCQLCNILGMLHAQNPPVIHRDIKPDNVIRRPDGTLVLIDFDISRVFKENGRSDTIFFGTKGYAPPEQYGFEQTDCRADIFALGVLLRWLVTGSTKENPNISMNPRLEKVIDRCTAFSPEDRYRDASQVRQALEAAQKGRPVRKGPILALAALFMCVLCLGFSAGRYTDWLRVKPRIQFQEPLIEKAVRLQLNKEKGALTEEELAGVKRIYIYGREAYSGWEEYHSQMVDQNAQGLLQNLQDLAMLKNLEELKIAHQGYVNVSTLAELTGLRTIELKHMRISGVQPIADLPRLQYAVLFDVGMRDASDLENCPWLEELDIGRNDITSLKQIGRHPNMRSLGLMWLKIDDLSGIAQQMPNLESVNLKYGTFRNCFALKDLRNLKNVYVLENQAEEMEALFAGTDVDIHVEEF